MSKTLIVGPSARGRTRIVLGGTYYGISFSAPEMWEPELYTEAPGPVELNWTKMNTSWKKGKRK